MNYSVGDFVIRIKNAVLANRKQVTFVYSKLAKAIASVLVQEGFLKSIQEEMVDGKKVLVGQLAFLKRMPVFSDVVLISKPSLRVYADKTSLVKESKKGLGTLVLSTSVGVITGKEALKKGVGGELLFKIW